jgi:hypothetical protein
MGRRVVSGVVRYSPRLAVSILVGVGVAVVLLAVPSPATASCHPIPVTWYSPTGVAGCEIYGEGIASTWPGPGAARNDCLWPWHDCQPIAVQSLQTGVTIIVTPTMYGDLYLGDNNPRNDRIVDLGPAMVEALGLDLGGGLWPVSVTPVDGSGQFLSSPALPDTALTP